MFLPDYLSNDINLQMMYGFHHILRQFRPRHLDVFRRAQVPIYVEYQSVMGYFNRERSKHRETHALPEQLFEFQVA